jgi:hypothetical protein
MPHFIFSGINETIRLDPTDTPSDISGLGTSGLKTCTAVILRGKESNRISLSHYHFKTNPQALLAEVKWVGEPFEIILAKNQAEVDACAKRCTEGKFETHNGNYDTEKNIIDFLKTLKWVKHIKKRIDTKSESVMIERTGEVSTWVTHDKIIVSSPDKHLRDAVQYLNSIYSSNVVEPTLEYDSKKFTSVADLGQAALHLLNCIQIRIKKLDLDMTEDNIFSTIESLDKIFKNAGGKNGAYLDMMMAIPDAKERVLKSMCVILKQGNLKPANFDDFLIKLIGSDLPSKGLRK